MNDGRRNRRSTLLGLERTRDYSGSAGPQGLALHGEPATRRRFLVPSYRPGIGRGGNVLGAPSAATCKAADCDSDRGEGNKGCWLPPVVTSFVRPSAHSGAGGLGWNSEASREEPEARESALAVAGRADMEQIDLWGLSAPTRRRDAQEGIGWTPADRQMSQVVQKRESKASRILARLQEGPATSIELAQITHRFSARILELRREHRISREDHVRDGLEWSTYTLEGKK